MKKIRQLDMELAGGCNYSCQMCPKVLKVVEKKNLRKY